MIGDTRALLDGCVVGKGIQNLFFTAKHQIDITGGENLLYFKNNFSLGFQGWINKRKTRQGSKAFLDFGIKIHKTGNTPFDFELSCLSGNVFQIPEIILNPVIVFSVVEKTDGVKAPVNRPGPESLTELFKLVQPNIQWRQMRL